MHNKKDQFMQNKKYQLIHFHAPCPPPYNYYCGVASLMACQQQQPYEDYEYYATQLLSTLGEQLSPPSSTNLIKLTISPIEISYQPVRIRRDRNTIIHDINSLTKRRKPSNHADDSPPQRKFRMNGEGSHRGRLPSDRQRAGLCLETLPTPREKLKQIRSEMKECQEQKEDYLKHNLGTVKERIRNFADPSPKHVKTEPREHIRRTPRRNRIDRYNHDFEEYLIRRRISKKGKSLPTDTHISPSYRSIEGRQETTRMEDGSPTVMRVDNRLGRAVKGKQPHDLYCSRDCEGPRLIIVSPMHPGHALSKFKNYVIENASKSSQRVDAEGLLKRYVDRNFGKGARSYEKQCERRGRDGEGEGGLQGVSIKKLPPANFVKSPLNYTLFKKQINRLRKESIGLPLLLEGQDEPAGGALLEERLNARKISCLLTVPQGEGRPSPKKYVVYSKKNLGGVAETTGDSP